MLSNSLLLTLASQPKEEDFLTAAFAYFLQNNPKVQKKYVRWLGFSPPARMTLSIQKSYGKARKNIVDMVISDEKDFILFQENKTESTDNRDQRFRYSKILSGRNEKVKILIYVTKYRETKKFKGKSNVRFKHKRWHEINSFLHTLLPTEHAGWMVDQLCQYLEGKNMASQNALDISKLNKGWGSFVPQKLTLELLFREAEAQLKSKSKHNDFRVKFYPGVNEMGLSIFRDKGRIIKPLMAKKFKIEAWVGIYYWDDGHTYFTTSISWHKNYTDRIKRGFPLLLLKNGFQPYPSRDQNQEEFYRGDKSLESVLGKSKSFESQLSRLSNWINVEANIVSSLLSKLEGRYWIK